MCNRNFFVSTSEEQAWWQCPFPTASAPPLSLQVELALGPMDYPPKLYQDSLRARMDPQCHQGSPDDAEREGTLLD